MKISANGLAVVKAFEGCHKAAPAQPGYFRAYYCPAKVLTIGYGHTNHHLPRFDASAVWSKEKCEVVLAGDMAGFEAHVRKNAPSLANQHQFDALTSWAFNTGGPASSAVWTYVRNGDAAAAVARLERWNKAGGQVLTGLVRRRKAECELYQGRVAQALATAGAVKPIGPSPRRLDTPVPPASEVAKKTKRESGTVAGGSVVGGGSAIPQKDGGMSAWGYAGIVLGVVIVVAGVVLFLRKRKAVIADWA